MTTTATAVTAATSAKAIKPSPAALPDGISAEMGLPERIWTYLPLATHRGASIAELAMLVEVFPTKPGESEEDRVSRISHSANHMARRGIIHKKDELVDGVLTALFRRKGRSRPPFRQGRGGFEGALSESRKAPAKLIPLHRAPAAAALTPPLSTLSQGEIVDVEPTKVRAVTKAGKGGKGTKAKAKAMPTRKGRGLQVWTGTSKEAPEVRPLAVTSSGMKGEIVEAQVQVLIRGNHYSVQEARLVYAELKQLFE